MFRLTCSLHSVHYSLRRVIRWSLLHFGTSYMDMCCATSSNTDECDIIYLCKYIYNLNSHLAHFNALWMKYIRLLGTGIMVEYPVMSTSLGTYIQIVQTSEAIREIYKMCRAGGCKKHIPSSCVVPLSFLIFPKHDQTLIFIQYFCINLKVVTLWFISELAGLVINSYEENKQEKYFQKQRV